MSKEFEHGQNHEIKSVGGDELTGGFIVFAIVLAPLVFFALGINPFYDPFDHLPKSHATIIGSRSEVNYETWVPATRQEAESGVYEIKVYHGGRGTHQYWKRLKKS